MGYLFIYHDLTDTWTSFRGYTGHRFVMGYLFLYHYALIHGLPWYMEEYMSQIGFTGLYVQNIIYHQVMTLYTGHRINGLIE